MTYAERLRDPRWQKLRLEVMQRDNFTCRNCGAKDRELQIHHLRYGEDICQPPEFLETLCVDCHSEREHDQKMLLNLIRELETPKFKLGFRTIWDAVELIRTIPSK
jgi:5-methylcytosine-specific restriction endonuclease McrA